MAGEGCDYSFLLDTNHDSEIVLKVNESSHTLTIKTDQASVVVYSKNFLKSDGEFRSTPSRKYLGICLQTQALSDAIHDPHFPSAVLDIDQKYSAVTVYKFGVEKN
ncbi:hypothetical protein [Domibacillus sp. PGB-M46]|uniref:aldose epimerase family protein n=1 Tax=Domibacillus sp. PGB-M46 TaxID=2910255 RepID=UPI0035C89B67